MGDAWRTGWAPHPALPQAALIDDGQRATGESPSLLSPSFGGRAIQVTLSIIRSTACESL